MIRGIQQLQVGRCLTSRRKTEEALNAIRCAGFEGIELNGFMIRHSPLIVHFLTRSAGMPIGRSDKLDWPTLLPGAGLSVIAIHEDLGFIEHHYSQLFAETRTYHTHRIVITGMYRLDYRDSHALSQVTKRLSRAASRLGKDGIQLLYHNHNIELQRTDRGEQAFDQIIRETADSPLLFELDTYWLAEAGDNALGRMQRMAPRLGLWHIDDRGTRLRRPPLTPLLKSDEIELGRGNMPLKEMLAVARHSPIQAVVLEMHRHFVNGSPLESMKISGAWLKQNRV